MRVVLLASLVSAVGCVEQSKYDRMSWAKFIDVEVEHHGHVEFRAFTTATNKTPTHEVWNFLNEETQFESAESTKTKASTNSAVRELQDGVLLRVMYHNHRWTSVSLDSLTLVKNAHQDSWSIPATELVQIRQTARWDRFVLYSLYAVVSATLIVGFLNWVRARALRAGSSDTHDRANGSVSLS